MPKTLLALLFATIPLAAQPVHFDVASIKPGDPSASVLDARLSFENNRFEAHNMTLKELLAAMSGFSSSNRIEGGPGWAETDRYNIEAKSENVVGVNDRNAAVMALLEDRFHLATHSEKREGNGMALTIGAKQPALQRAAEGEQGAITGDVRRLEFRGTTMRGLAIYLSQIWRVTVEDRTDLPGAFDFSVSPIAFATNPSDKFRDLLQPAMEDFGFTLQPRKVQLDITIIDRAERPSAN